MKKMTNVLVSWVSIHFEIRMSNYLKFFTKSLQSGTSHQNCYENLFFKNRVMGTSRVTMRENYPISEILWSVFSPNAGKYGPEKLRIRTLFTDMALFNQIKLHSNRNKSINMHWKSIDLFAYTWNIRLIKVEFLIEKHLSTWFNEYHLYDLFVAIWLLDF